MTAPAVYARPPAPRRMTGAIPSLWAISGIAATPTQPSATPMTADSHFGALTQQNFEIVATAAPDHTIERTVTRHAPSRLIRPTGVYVPAIRREIPAWSARRIHRRAWRPHSTRG